MPIVVLTAQPVSSPAQSQAAFGVLESVPIAPAREEEKPKLDDNHIRDVCRTRRCTVAVPERSSRWSRVHHRCCRVRRAEA